MTATHWERIERAETPDGTRLELFRRGNHYSIRVNGELLMNSRVHHSEEEFAKATLAALGPRTAARVLVGGLGCGYTLAAALAGLGPEGTVVVAEIAPAVVRWNRERLGALNGHPLEDARTRVFEGDVCDLICTPAQPFDAILLDVDNGPRAVARPGNGWLYSPDGLRAIQAALTPGGVLAIWSAGPEVGFSTRLRDAGFTVSMQRVRSHPGRAKEPALIWLASVG